MKRSIRNPLLVAAVALSILSLSSGDVLGSGSYRGPGGQVPPTGRVPSATGTAKISPVPGEPGGPAYTGPSGQQIGGRGASIGARLDREGGNSRARRTGNNRRKKSGADGFSSWEYWWAFHRESFFAGRQILASGGSTESLDYLLGKGDADNVRDVVNPTSRMIREEVIPALKRAMSDHDSDVRVSSILALGKIGNQTDYPVFLQGLRDPHWQVRQSSALGLGILGSSYAIPHLASILEGKEEGLRLTGQAEIHLRTRAFAALGLGLIGTQQASSRKNICDILLRALAIEEATADIPVCAALALGVLGERRAVPALVSLSLDPRRDPLVKAHAVTALGKIGDPRALPAVRQGIRDRSVHVHRSSVLALGLLAKPGDSASLSLLISTARRGRDGQGRNWALAALGRVGGDQAAKVLFDRLQGGQKEDKVFAAFGVALLERSGDFIDSATEATHEVFRKTRDDRTKSGLGIALALMGQKDVKADLLTVLGGKGEAQAQGYTAVALGILGERSAAPMLKEKLRGTGPVDFKRSLATALGLMGDRNIAEDLMKMILTSSSAPEKNAAATAMGFVKDTTFVAPLIEVLDDRRKFSALVRTQAALALGFVCDEREVPLLHAIMENTNYRTPVDALTEAMSIL